MSLLPLELAAETFFTFPVVLSHPSPNEQFSKLTELLRSLEWALDLCTKDDKKLSDLGFCVDSVNEHFGHCEAMLACHFVSHTAFLHPNALPFRSTRAPGQLKHLRTYFNTARTYAFVGSPPFELDARSVRYASSA